MTGNSEESAPEVDQSLNPEEARFVRHYLGYADTLLKLDPAEEMEPKEALEELSLQEISLAEAADSIKFIDAEFTSDAVGIAMLTSEQLDPENSTKAA